MGQIIIIIATIIGTVVCSIKADDIKSSLFESNDVSHIIYEKTDNSFKAGLNGCDFKTQKKNLNLDLILNPIPTIIDMIDSSEISLPKYSFKLNSLLKIDKQFQRGLKAIL